MHYSISSTCAHNLKMSILLCRNIKCIKIHDLKRIETYQIVTNFLIWNSEIELIQLFKNPEIEAGDLEGGGLTVLSSDLKPLFTIKSVELNPKFCNCMYSSGVSLS